MSKHGNFSGKTIAVIGNPNAGKSALFNALTGLHQKVANYPGVTVDFHIGRFHSSHGAALQIVDLPGAYSLHSNSPDERLTRDILLGRQEKLPAPDLVLCVLDASNLERNLYLAAQVAELGVPLVFALNMIDVAERKKQRIDVPELSRLLGAPVVATVANRKRGLAELRQAITQQIAKEQTPERAGLPEALEEKARELGRVLEDGKLATQRSAYVEALLCLTAADERAWVELPAEVRGIVATNREELVRAGIDPIVSPIQARYFWIRENLQKAFRSEAEQTLSMSDKLDAVLTHKVWGWMVFLGVMALMFFCIFNFAEIPMGWIESLTGWLGGLAENVIPEGDFRSLVVDGIIAGVGGVVTFLPQIIILFIFIGLLEDTGYMARAAFVIDRLMRLVGLHGKSFVPMLSSVACAIPGIMSARTINNRNDRLVTVLVAPLMSCSARIPVYMLMIALLLPTQGAWAKALVMMGLYLSGLFAACGMAWIFRKTILRGERALLLLEMPPYRRPVLKLTLWHACEKGWAFLKNAGTIILAISILIWAASNYPKASVEVPHSQALSESVAGRLGHFIEPAIAPLGYDWKMGIGLITSFAAREAFVSTMAIIYADTEDAAALEKTMSKEMRADGKTPVYTTLTALSVLAFYVLAMQCGATLATVRRETGTWRWPIFQLVYMTALAWIVAFVIYQGGQLLGFQ